MNQLYLAAEPYAGLAEGVKMISLFYFLITEKKKPLMF